jgi:hypothetical protein
MALRKSRKKFLFGRVYTIVDSAKDRIDETHITERDMEEIIGSRSVFEINKNNFLNDFYVKASTKQTEYYLYNSSILYHEEAKDKDISQFTSSEIKDLVESVPTSSKGQQYRVFKFINQYCKWMVSQRFISLNPCDSLDKNDFTANVRALRNKVIGLDKFWDTMELMMGNGCHIQLLLPLVLSRYGIYGKDAYDLLHLRYEQVDVENKIVTLYYEDGTFKTKLPIDDRFIQMIERSKVEDTVDSMYNAYYLDTGYIARRSSLAGANAGDIETIPSMVKRVNTAYSYIKGHPKIKFNNLVKSRKLDFIFRIRENRKINTEDVLNVIRLFEPTASAGSYYSLVSDIEALTGDKVLYKYEKGVKLIDKNAKEFVDSIIDDLEFYGYDK